MAALNALVNEVYKLCLDAPNSILTQQQIFQSVSVDAKVLVDALNLLLKKKLLKLLKNGNQNSYKAVRKAEAKVKGDMGNDEAMAYSHIEGAGNQGIWTKTLKARTGLHQTVLNRCLKTLEQKSLVKSIKSVQFPTRKLYMLSHLTPSTDVSGGPWYTDNELDTEFIRTVMASCLAFIKSRSFPKPTTKCAQPIYSASYTKKYPNVNEITEWLRRANITTTELNAKHVQMLLDVLVYDGEIEAIPSFGAPTVEKSDAETSEDDDDGKRKKEKKGKKGNKRAASDEDEDGVMESDSSNDGSSKRKKKRSRVEVSSDDDPDDHRASSSKRKKRKRDEEDSDDDSDDKHKSSKRHKKSRSRRSDNDSDDDSDGSDDRKGKKKSKSSKKKPFKREREDSPEVLLDLGASVVYRVVRQEKIGLGWSQAPCGRCPQFEFCHDKGPVNAAGCRYYSDWFEQPIGVEMEEAEQPPTP
ncbi:hypothetical protein BOTBODRAFT_45033 [Botryobasidium botryosum FD-172 SS1]|uniref:DNA-directed RNA polymerase III subunit RPC6 n=1 Tax=Botryobasidium botryosum (strain FD-172 SS1) TaxID=930990 RepID=A0A067MEB9_BOTB1|nr:hypothetical protein BOTBODRAFT_45033 [Botryobasidium botryosum FD-172 SS1]